MRPALRSPALLAVLLAVGCGSGDPPATPEASDGPRRAAGAEPRVEVIAGGLEVPWDVAFLPDGRALVTERPGRVRLLSRDGEIQDEPVADIHVEPQGEGGLMGIALDPAFASGRRFAYVMITSGGEVRVLRLEWSGGRLHEDETVLDGIEAGVIHDSGRLRFGPDERLYVLTGDAGRRELAQQRGSLNGRILALDPAQYRGGGDSDPEEVSHGHRNPQGLDWDPRSGRLFATEHGPSGFDGPSCCDELNAIEPGGDYGWPRFGDDQPRVARPAHLWRSTIAPSGMAFVTQGGSAWSGDVLVAALRGRSLRRLAVDGRSAREVEVLLQDRYGRLRAVVEAPDGTIWVTTSNLDPNGARTSPDDDRVLRVVPPVG